MIRETHGGLHLVVFTLDSHSYYSLHSRLYFLSIFFPSISYTPRHTRIRRGFYWDPRTKCVPRHYQLLPCQVCLLINFPIRRVFAPTPTSDSPPFILQLSLQSRRKFQHILSLNFRFNRKLLKIHVPFMNYPVKIMFSVAIFLPSFINGHAELTKGYLRD